MKQEDIYLQNPWWRSVDKIDEDSSIMQFNRSSFKFFPAFLDVVDFKQKGIFTLRGPRQVGKTTSLKLMIKQLLDYGNNPSDILYLTLDNINGKEELTETIKNWLLLRRKASSKKQFLFLDEISFIKDWQYSIKYLYDINLLNEAFVFLSGSSAYDIKRSSERLPGRRGAGIDLIQLPVSFREFIQTTYNESLKPYSLSEILHLSDSDIKLLNYEYARYIPDFNIYRNAGGFPRVINAYLKENMINDSVLKVYEDFILGDIERFSKSRFTLTELIKKTPGIIGQRFSWHSINNHINAVSSSNTVESYFQILGMNFIAATLFFFDPSKREINPKKQKKIYPLDPIISRVIEKLSGKQIKEGNDIESLVLENILRITRKTTEGLNLYYGPYYWYSAKGKEVDFLIEQDAGLFPLEVKYQNQINRSDYTTIKRNFKEGFLLSKDTAFRDENVLILPVYLFLLLL